MVLEKVVLRIKPGLSPQFEQDFQIASKIISSMKGYLEHSLMRCIENEDQYLLLVKWRTLEDHETGFRKSEKYQKWKELLHHYYNPFPKVEHYELI